ncbi:MAG: hypothetical protein A2583_12850 [Bdellovibrionales bacterium RIFOXYD1_FULL_53_11]|nr:MAG: hypothetical protein A2583_12850 [Bdellovibrionales bacterium RIFOXYD1_FULL_53_11]
MMLIGTPIKDFRDGYEFSKYCYTGGAKSIRELLTALVDAVFTVLATITDEGGSVGSVCPASGANGKPDRITL